MDKHIFWFLLLAIAIGQSACQYKNNIPNIENGLLNLPNADIENDGEIQLNGKWEFYSRQFYSIKDLETQKPKPVYLTVPGGWNELKMSNSALHPGDGYGTYHLRILLKNHPDTLAILIPTVSTAMKVWINDDLIGSAGKIGTDQESSKPSYKSYCKNFIQKSDTLDIILHVSNFHYRKGGAWNVFTIGTPKDIQEVWLYSIIRNFFLIGGLTLIGLYFITTFYILRGDYSPLSFGIFCLLLTIRILCSDLFHINLIFPMDWDLLIKCELIGYYTGLPVFVLFANQLFPREANYKITKWIMIISFMFILFLFAPVIAVGFTVIPFEIFSILCIFYGLYVNYKAWKNKRDGSKLFLVGFLVLSFTAMNDILFNNNLIDTGNFIYIGIMFLIFSLSITLTQKFSMAFVRIGETNEELKEKNKEIEDKNIQLVKLNEELDAFVYRTSHDLRSPITSVIGLLQLAKQETDPEQLVIYFDMGEKVLKRMDGLISDIINFTRNSRGEVTYEKIDFEQLIEDVFVNYAFLQNASMIEKTYTINKDIEFFSDIRRISFILNNLVSNAIKYHDDKKSNQYIKIDIKIEAKQVFIKLTDNGQGIKAEHVDKIFQMFYRATNSSQGAGLGLYIVKETVEKLHGAILVNSEDGVGTTFQITLPNMKQT